MNHKRLVQESYNTIAADYLTSRNDETEDVQLLEELLSRLSEGARVLDAGCGAGVPVSEILSRRFEVTGVDFAASQIDLARQRVPNATFICHDIVDLDLPDNTFDGVCSYYAIIHIPRSEHARLLRNLHRMLKPAGLALLCLGADDIEEDIVNDYFGSPMYWSHFDAETNKRLVQECGFDIVLTRLISDASCPTSQHLFILAKKEDRDPA